MGTTSTPFKYMLTKLQRCAKNTMNEIDQNILRDFKPLAKVPYLTNVLHVQK